MSFQTETPHKMTLAEISARQDQERGLTFMPLQPELLIKRVKAGGHSGQFLADAFISAYRINQPFNHSLGELIRIDAEGFRLFHQILHIRLIPNWSDQTLYEVEQQIKALHSKEGGK